jgi:hypothetical protein
MDFYNKKLSSKINSFSQISVNHNLSSHFSNIYTTNNNNNIIQNSNNKVELQNNKFDIDKNNNKIKLINTYPVDYNQKIGVIIPTTNKGKSWKKAEDTYLFNYTIKSILNTTNENYIIVFYIGIDIDDKLWQKSENYASLMKFRENRKNIDFKFFKMINIKPGHVTEMWNRLFLHAYKDNCNYFLQCGDDIIFSTIGWLDNCINILKLHNNIGLTGPVSDNPYILTQTFVSRKHMEIFNLYFPTEIKNWYCDDWINQVYQPNYFYPLTNHKCYNSGGDPRYSVEVKMDIYYSLVKNGHKKLLSYVNK